MNIKLTFQQKTFVNQNAKQHSLIQSFIYFCSKMDVSGIESILDDDMIINEQSKWEFLTYVRDRFNDFKPKGITSLQLSLETCKLCFKGCSIHLFKGNSNRDWIAFYFQKENEILKDIIICNYPSGTHLDEIKTDFS